MSTTAVPTAAQLAVLRQFYDTEPVSLQVINTSHGEEDFREVLIAAAADGSKTIVKLAANDFTTPQRIAMWQRTAAEYRRLGCYCPAILADKAGVFPTVDYAGHSCVAYGEEFALHRPADTFAKDAADPAAYLAHAWAMTAQVAAQYFDYTDLPSAYCLFETFAPSDEMDEALENANAWCAFAQTLPAQYRWQVQRIRQLWDANRAALKPLYAALPRSVFQADLNPGNILLDEAGKFAGVLDFNCAGREVFLNYLMRESLHSDFDTEVQIIRRNLRSAAQHYSFSNAEKLAAPLLYRCLKPLWYNKLLWLRQKANDTAALTAYLDATEQALTKDIDFFDAAL